MAQVVLANHSESNFWSERRKANEKLDIRPSAPVQLASLPAPLSNLMSGGLPSSLVLPKFSSALKNQFPNDLSPTRIDELTNIMKSLPTQYGNVRKITFPKKVRTGHTVIHIQDVHLNSEAQNNIGKTIQRLIVDNRIDQIALEGAFAPIDLTSFRNFSDQAVIRKVANYLLKENQISGPLHAVLTSSKSIPPIVGVDDLEHYNKNVEAYQESAPLVEKYKKAFDAWGEQLSKKKVTTFNPALLVFDQQVEAHHKGTLPFGSYLRLLSDHFTQLSLEVKTFLETLKMESDLNSAQVERERTQVISKLMREMNQSQVSELVNMSVAYRLGQVRHTDFYAFVQSLCQKNHLTLAHFRAMDHYIRYVLLSETIQTEKVFGAAKRMEADAYSFLCKTPAETQLVQEIKKHRLGEKLLSFSLTPEEWGEYQKINHKSQTLNSKQTSSSKRETPNNSLSFIVSDLKLSSSLEFVICDLKFLESFYQEAQARDELIAKNFLSLRSKYSVPSTTVLVTGGFHSTGIEKQLLDAGTTVITFVPKITRLGAQTQQTYLSVFTQEKTPLDKLFEGEKLFLSPPVAASLYKVLTLSLAEAVRKKLLPIQSIFKQLVPNSTGQLFSTILSSGENIFVRLKFGSQAVSVGFGVAGEILPMKEQRYSLSVFDWAFLSQAPILLSVKTIFAQLAAGLQTWSVRSVLEGVNKALRATIRKGTLRFPSWDNGKPMEEESNLRHDIDQDMVAAVLDSGPESIEKLFRKAMSSQVDDLIFQTNLAYRVTLERQKGEQHFLHAFLEKTLNFLQSLESVGDGGDLDSRELSDYLESILHYFSVDSDIFSEFAHFAYGGRVFHFDLIGLHNHFLPGSPSDFHMQQNGLNLIQREIIARRILFEEDNGEMLLLGSIKALLNNPLITLSELKAPLMTMRFQHGTVQDVFLVLPKLNVTGEKMLVPFTLLTPHSPEWSTVVRNEFNFLSSFRGDSNTSQVLNLGMFNFEGFELFGYSSHFLNKHDEFVYVSRSEYTVNNETPGSFTKNSNNLNRGGEVSGPGVEKIIAGFSRLATYFYDPETHTRVNGFTSTAGDGNFHEDGFHKKAKGIFEVNPGRAPLRSRLIAFRGVVQNVDIPGFIQYLFGLSYLTPKREDIVDDGSHGEELTEGVLTGFLYGLEEKYGTVLALEKGIDWLTQYLAAVEDPAGTIKGDILFNKKILGDFIEKLKQMQNLNQGNVSLPASDESDSATPSSILYHWTGSRGWALAGVYILEAPAFVFSHFFIGPIFTAILMAAFAGYHVYKEETSSTSNLKRGPPWRRFVLHLALFLLYLLVPTPVFLDGAFNSGFILPFLIVSTIHFVKDVIALYGLYPRRTRGYLQKEKHFLKNKPAHIFLDVDNFLVQGTLKLVSRIYGELFYRVRHGISLDESIKPLDDDDLKEGVDFLYQTTHMTEAEHIPAVLEKFKEAGIGGGIKEQEIISFFEGRYKDLYADYVDWVPHAQGFIESLIQMKKDRPELKIYLLSYAAQFAVELLAKHFQFKDNLDGIFGSNWDEQKRGSQNPKARKILAIVGKDLDAFVAMGGDSVSDVTAAVEATKSGVPTFSFTTTTGASSEEQLKKAGSDVVLPNLANSEAIFRQMSHPISYAADRLIEKYSLDPKKATEFAALIREGDFREVKNGVITHQGKKLAEYLPRGSVRYFDLNGRWIMTLDPYGNAIEQLLWSAEGKFERIEFWGPDRKVYVMEPSHRQQDPNSIDKVSLKGDESDFVWTFSDKGLNFSDFPGRGCHVLNRKNNLLGFGFSILNIQAWLALDRNVALDYGSQRISTILKEALLQVGKDIDYNKTGSVWPHPAERIFGPNEMTLVRDGKDDLVVLNKGAKIHDVLGDAANKFLKRLLPSDWEYVEVVPGMKFNDINLWWNNHGHRSLNHLGFDFTRGRTKEGVSRPIPEGTVVTSITDGKIVRVVEDEMQSSVFVKTNIMNERGDWLVINYTHIKPTRSFSVDDFVRKGESLGTIERSRNLTAMVAAHLHLSTAWIPDHGITRFNNIISNWIKKKTEDPSDKRPVWDVLDPLVTEEKLFSYFEPLGLFHPDDRQLFHDIDYQKDILRVLIVHPTKNPPIWKIKKPIGLRYPGVLIDEIREVEWETALIESLTISGRKTDVVISPDPEIFNSLNAMNERYSFGWAVVHNEGDADKMLSAIDSVNQKENNLEIGSGKNSAVNISWGRLLNQFWEKVSRIFRSLIPSSWKIFILGGVFMVLVGLGPVLQRQVLFIDHVSPLGYWMTLIEISYLITLLSRLVQDGYGFVMRRVYPENSSFQKPALTWKQFASWFLVPNLTRKELKAVTERSSNEILGFIVIGFLGQFLNTFFIIDALRSGVPPLIFTTIMTIEFVGTLLLAHVVLGEKLNRRHFIGMLLITLGSFLAAYVKSGDGNFIAALIESGRVSVFIVALIHMARSIIVKPIINNTNAQEKFRTLWTLVKVGYNTGFWAVMTLYLLVWGGYGGYISWFGWVVEEAGPLQLNGFFGYFQFHPFVPVLSLIFISTWWLAYYLQTHMTLREFTFLMPHIPFVTALLSFFILGQYISPYDLIAPVINLIGYTIAVTAMKNKGGTPTDKDQPSTFDPVKNRIFWAFILEAPILLMVKPIFLFMTTGPPAWSVWSGLGVAALPSLLVWVLVHRRVYLWSQGEIKTGHLFSSRGTFLSVLALGSLFIGLFGLSQLSSSTTLQMLALFAPHLVYNLIWLYIPQLRPWFEKWRVPSGTGGADSSNDPLDSQTIEEIHSLLAEAMLWWRARIQVPGSIAPEEAVRFLGEIYLSLIAQGKLPSLKLFETLFLKNRSDVRGRPDFRRYSAYKVLLKADMVRAQTGRESLYREIIEEDSLARSSFGIFAGLLELNMALFEKGLKITPDEKIIKILKVISPFDYMVSDLIEKFNSHRVQNGGAPLRDEELDRVLEKRRTKKSATLGELKPHSKVVFSVEAEVDRKMDREIELGYLDSDYEEWNFSQSMTAVQLVGDIIDEIIGSIDRGGVPRAIERVEAILLKRKSDAVFEMFVPIFIKKLNAALIQNGFPQRTAFLPDSQASSGSGAATNPESEWLESGVSNIDNLKQELLRQSIRDPRKFMESIGVLLRMDRNFIEGGQNPRFLALYNDLFPKIEVDNLGEWTVVGLVRVIHAMVRKGMFPHRIPKLETFLLKQSLRNFASMYGSMIVEIDEFLIRSFKKPFFSKLWGNQVGLDLMTPIFVALIDQGKVPDVVVRKAEIWEEKGLPFDHDGTTRDLYARCPDPEAFIDNLKKQAETRVRDGFDLNDPEQLFQAYIGVLQNQIKISWRDFTYRMEIIGTSEKKIPGFFQAMFEKPKTLQSFQITAKGVRHLGTEQVDWGLLETHFQKLLEAKKRIDSLSWVPEFFESGPRKGLRQLIKLTNEMQVKDGAASIPDEILNSADDDLLKRELLARKKYFYQAVFKNATGRLRDSSRDWNGLMRDMMISHVFENQDIVSTFHSNDPQTRIDAFKTFYGSYVTYLPTSLNMKSPLAQKKPLEDFYSEIVGELAKAVTVASKGEDVLTLVPVGFLGFFRGRAGIIDSSFDTDKGAQFAYAMHPDTLYYFVYKDKKLVGYVGLMWGREYNEQKVLAMRNIQSPFLDGEPLLMNLFTAVDQLARNMGGSGTGLPGTLKPAFNFSNQHTIPHLKIYQDAEPVKLTHLRADEWGEFKKTFGSDPYGYDTMEGQSFVALKFPANDDFVSLSIETGRRAAQSILGQLNLSSARAQNILDDLEHNTQPFSWKYKEYGTKEITELDGRPGIKGFLAGFRSMGIFRNWCLLNHAYNQQGWGDVYFHLKGYSPLWSNKDLVELKDYIEVLAKAVGNEANLIEKRKRDLRIIGVVEGAIAFLEAKVLEVNEGSQGTYSKTDTFHSSVVFFPFIVTSLSTPQTIELLLFIFAGVMYVKLGARIFWAFLFEAPILLLMKPIFMYLTTGPPAWSVWPALAVAALPSLLVWILVHRRLYTWSQGEIKTGHLFSSKGTFLSVLALGSFFIGLFGLSQLSSSLTLQMLALFAPHFVYNLIWLYIPQLMPLFEKWKIPAATGVGKSSNNGSVLLLPDQMFSFFLDELEKIAKDKNKTPQTNQRLNKLRIDILERISYSGRSMESNLVGNVVSSEENPLRVLLALVFFTLDNGPGNLTPQTLFRLEHKTLPLLNLIDWPYSWSLTTGDAINKLITPLMTNRMFTYFSFPLLFNYALSAYYETPSNKKMFLGYHLRISDYPTPFRERNTAFALMHFWYHFRANFSKTDRLDLQVLPQLLNDALHMWQSPNTSNQLREILGFAIGFMPLGMGPGITIDSEELDETWEDLWSKEKDWIVPLLGNDNTLKPNILTQFKKVTSYVLKNKDKTLIGAETDLLFKLVRKSILWWEPSKKPFEDFFLLPFHSSRNLPVFYTKRNKRTGVLDLATLIRRENEAFFEGIEKMGLIKGPEKKLVRPKRSSLVGLSTKEEAERKGWRRNGLKTDLLFAPDHETFKVFYWLFHWREFFKEHPGNFWKSGLRSAGLIAIHAAILAPPLYFNFWGELKLWWFLSYAGAHFMANFWPPSQARLVEKLIILPVYLSQFIAHFLFNLIAHLLAIFGFPFVALSSGDYGTEGSSNPRNEGERIIHLDSSSTEKDWLKVEDLIDPIEDLNESFNPLDVVTTGRLRDQVSLGKMVDIVLYPIKDSSRLIPVGLIQYYFNEEKTILNITNCLILDKRYLSEEAAFDVIFKSIEKLRDSARAVQIMIHDREIEKINLFRKHGFNIEMGVQYGEHIYLLMQSGSLKRQSKEIPLVKGEFVAESASPDIRGMVLLQNKTPGQGPSMWVNELDELFKHGRFFGEILYPKDLLGKKPVYGFFSLEKNLSSNGVRTCTVDHFRYWGDDAAVYLLIVLLNSHIRQGEVVQFKISSVDVRLVQKIKNIFSTIKVGRETLFTGESGNFVFRLKKEHDLAYSDPNGETKTYGKGALWRMLYLPFVELIHVLNRMWWLPADVKMRLDFIEHAPDINAISNWSMGRILFEISSISDLLSKYISDGKHVSDKADPWDLRKVLSLSKQLFIPLDVLTKIETAVKDLESKDSSGPASASIIFLIAESFAQFFSARHHARILVIGAGLGLISILAPGWGEASWILWSLEGGVGTKFFTVAGVFIGAHLLLMVVLMLVQWLRKNQGTRGSPLAHLGISSVFYLGILSSYAFFHSIGLHHLGIATHLLFDFLIFLSVIRSNLGRSNEVASGRQLQRRAALLAGIFVLAAKSPSISADQVVQEFFKGAPISMGVGNTFQDGANTGSDQDFGAVVNHAHFPAVFRNEVVKQYALKENIVSGNVVFEIASLDDLKKAKKLIDRSPGMESATLLVMKKNEKNHLEKEIANWKITVPVTVHVPQVSFLDHRILVLRTLDRALPQNLRDIQTLRNILFVSFHGLHIDDSGVPSMSDLNRIMVISLGKGNLEMVMTIRDRLALDGVIHRLRLICQQA